MDLLIYCFTFTAVKQPNTSPGFCLLKLHVFIDLNVTFHYTVSPASRIFLLLSVSAVVSITAHSLPVENLIIDWQCHLKTGWGINIQYIICMRQSSYIDWIYLGYKYEYGLQPRAHLGATLIEQYCDISLFSFPVQPWQLSSLILLKVPTLLFKCICYFKKEF